MFFEYEKKEKTRIDEYTWVNEGHLKVSPKDFAEIKDKFTKEDYFDHILSNKHFYNQI